VAKLWMERWYYQAKSGNPLQGTRWIEASAGNQNC
jgi:hypothetical protein